MFKKIFAIAALAASMALVSCGGNDTASSSSDASNKTEENGGGSDNSGNKDNKDNKDDKGSSVDSVTAETVMEALNNASSEEEFKALVESYKEDVNKMPADVQQTLEAAAKAKYDALKKGATGAVSGAVQAGEEYVKDKMGDMPDMPSMDMPEPAMPQDF